MENHETRFEYNKDGRKSYPFNGIKLGEFAEMIHVHPKTLQRYDRQGILKPHRTETNRRYYTYEQYLEFMKVEE